MAADMRAETGPGASGWAARQPHVQRHRTGFRAETDHRQHEGRRAHPRSEVWAVGGDHGEGLAPGAVSQQHQCQEQRGCAELGHHPVPLAGPLDLVAHAMVGQHQQQRRHRHELPQEQEGADGRRGRHEQQRRDEKGEHARRSAAGESMALVAEAKNHGAQSDAGRDGDEERPEPTETERESEQREQLGGVHRGRVAGGEHVGGQHEPADAGGQDQRDRPLDPSAWRRAGTNQRGGKAEQGRGHQEVGSHLPDKPRSAAMMASGSGGQPGISTSTGTRSPTAPATP